MTEMILSDITIMGQGYCVIGLEQITPGSFRSLRPCPPRAYAWSHPFRARRGDRVLAQLTRLPAVKPHVEDHQSQGLKKTGAALDESQLVSALKHAEVARCRQEMFACGIRSSGSRGNGWVRPGEGSRSICGCELKNLRFRIVEYPERTVLRAQLVNAAGERLESLPVVDREWVEAFRRLRGRFQDKHGTFRAERLLNGPIRRELLQSPDLFARIGLARGVEDHKCWLMLDSLFPQPKDSWFELIERT